MKRTGLKVFRIRKGLTQRQMAEILGISESHYSGIEQGVQNPSYSVIEAFTKAFGAENVKVMTERG